jgi:hypothetical protein
MLQNLEKNVTKLGKFVHINYMNIWLFWVNFSGPNSIKGSNVVVESAFFLHLVTFIHYCMKNIPHN